MSDTDRNPVEVLADEFAARFRSGEHPSVAEYTTKYPEHAEEIEELFPSIVMMEQLKRKQESDIATVQRQLSFAGRRLDRLGDYEIVREVGRGGMGVVFEAVQGSLGRRVALKVLSDSAMASEKQIQRFEREARAAAALHHTNIVPVFGVGHEDDLHFYVMQFIEGVALDEVLAALRLLAAEQGSSSGSESAVVLARALRSGSFARPRKLGSSSSMSLARETVVENADETASRTRAPQSVFEETHVLSEPPQLVAAEDEEMNAAGDEASQGDGKPEVAPDLGLSAGAFGDKYFKSVARIGLQVADALQYAHGQQVLHRDIKPGNLVLDAQGTAWVTDFGLAKLMEQQDLTRTGDIVGTLRYMAPEQLEGKSDGRSDIYSLGLTLYEMLTLQPACDEKVIKQRLEHRGGDRVPRPRSINKAIPADLETIVLKAMAHDPQHRYATAETLAEDLQRFLDDRPILARRATPAERLWRWSRRNPAMAGVSGTALVLALMVVGLLGFGLWKAESGRQKLFVERNRANAEKNRANENLNLAFGAFDEIISNFGKRGEPTLFELESEDSGNEEQVAYYQTAVTAADAALLEKLLGLFGNFASQTGSPEFELRSAKAYRRIGDIQRSLNNQQAAIAAYQRSLQTYERLAGSESGEVAHVVAQAEVLNELADAYWISMSAGSEQVFRNSNEALFRARDLLQAELRADPESAKPEVRFALAETYLHMIPPFRPRRSGSRRPRGGEIRGGEMRGGDPGRRPPKMGGGHPSGKSPRSSGRNELAGRVKVALTEAKRLLTALVEESPENDRYRFALARCYQGEIRMAGFSSMVSGADAPLEGACQEAADLLQVLVDRDPQNPRYRYELAETLTLACTLPKYGGSRIEQQQHAVRIAEELVEDFPAEPRHAALLASCLQNEAELLVEADRLPEAIAQAEAARRQLLGLVERYPAGARYRNQFQDASRVAFNCYRLANDAEGVRRVFREAITALAELPPQLSFVKYFSGRLIRDFEEYLVEAGEVQDARQLRERFPWAWRGGGRRGMPSRSRSEREPRADR